MTSRRQKKISFKIKFLLGLILFILALSFVDAPSPLNPDTIALPSSVDEYHRGVEQTYLTFPEWCIVYSSDEYAQFIKDQRPSAFPYFGSIKQFWSGYRHIYEITKPYPFNAGYHVMVLVIGTSLSVEYIIKGGYENTIGRLTEWSRTHGLTQEDRFAADMAVEYVNFIRIYPWYEFDFAKKLRELWKATDLGGNDLFRKTERKLILSVEYGAKAAYGWVIKKMTYLSYEPASPFTVVQVDASSQIPTQDRAVKLIKQLEDDEQLLAMPRYDAFKDYALKLAEANVSFQKIADNTDVILVSIIVKRSWEYSLPQGGVLFTQPILTQPDYQRLAIKMPVSFLSEALILLKQQEARIEHIYDY